MTHKVPIDTMPPHVAKWLSMRGVYVMSSYVLGKIDLALYGYGAHGETNTGNNLNKEIDYLNAIPKQREEYDEFGQGFWKNLSLYNASGLIEDTQYRDTDKCLPTSYMDQCPTIKRIIDDIFELHKLKMVRARNLIDGMVMPHRDFVELGNEKRYFRVFLAIERNDDSFHSDEAGVFQMMPGEIWFLDAGIDHAAVNFSVKSRMFLCFDFMLTHDEDERCIFKDNANIDFNVKTKHIKRHKIDDYQKQVIIENTSALLNKNTFKDLTFTLSKLHFTHDIEVREAYDLLIEAAKKSKMTELLKKATSLKRYMVEQRSMGERFSINSWQA
ncbi:MULTISPECIES: aspartyl/asparaginyl beta-hydroxylase domain-containing protein [Aeromonas]|uniref:aspartyl/asparaginyl beta-hydroxylase domain-containing protein n=1 Tax=Aeromonas TaxID=642 RepID=UPI002B052B00|nr:aspartyl/asparaginyl beta-hydroxylase domain-containing protein [Aeromonas jandaei]